jgi:hypothetical protein
MQYASSFQVDPIPVYLAMGNNSTKIFNRKINSMKIEGNTPFLTGDKRKYLFLLILVMSNIFTIIQKYLSCV